MDELLTFSSEHNGTSRTYRVVDPGTVDRLTSCEYLRIRAGSANEWRPAKSGDTRHVAHCLVHGSPHASLTTAAAKSVQAKAAKVRTA